MEKEVDEYFGQYQGFVDQVTSPDSTDSESFIKRIREIEKIGLNFAATDTAITGLAGEAGEIADLWKKIKFHGKQWDVNSIRAMKDECGDVLWYLSKLMKQLDHLLTKVIEDNIHKLESRYPGGKFSIERSEVRDRESDPNYEGKNIYLEV